jgi:hypothetical protein
MLLLWGKRTGPKLSDCTACTETKILGKKQDSKNITQCRSLSFTQLTRNYQCNQTRIRYDDLSHTTHVKTDRYVQLALKTGKAATWGNQKLRGELKIKLTGTVGTQTRLNCLLSLVPYIFRVTSVHIHVCSQISARLV